jgi:hypothetical protein
VLMNKLIGGQIVPLSVSKIGPCTYRRHSASRPSQPHSLRFGTPTAHSLSRLPLLPSGPGGVHGRLLRRTEAINTKDVARLSALEGLGQASTPL